MTEYNKMAKGRFVSTGLAKIVNLPFQPDVVELWNYTAYAAAATSQNILKAYWDNQMGQGFALIEGYNATPALIGDLVSVNGISTFAGGLSLQYGAAQQIVSITKASAGVVTVTAHGLASGDVVILTGLNQSATTGMQQIAGMPFTITRIDANSFSIPWNTNQSNYTALSGSPTGAFMKKVLYPYLYAPGTSVISAITATNGSTIPAGTVQVDTTSAHNFVVGQEVAFRIPTSWGSYQLNSLPNTTIPGSPVYGYVVSVTDYNTVIVQIAAASSFTAYNSNQTFLGYPGEFFPQIVAVGDVNTGGDPISANSVLYPPRFIRPIGTTQVNSINGPAIQGAFFNNTSQGFIIGAGAGAVLTTGNLVGAAESVIYWRAYLHDINIPS